MLTFNLGIENRKIFLTIRVKPKEKLSDSFEIPKKRWNMQRCIYTRVGWSRIYSISNLIRWTNFSSNFLTRTWLEHIIHNNSIGYWWNHSFEIILLIKYLLSEFGKANSDSKVQSDFFRFFDKFVQFSAKCLSLNIEIRN